MVQILFHAFLEKPSELKLAIQRDQGIATISTNIYDEK